MFSSFLNIVLCFQSEWESNQFDFLGINSTRTIIVKKDQVIKVVSDFIKNLMTEESIAGLLVIMKRHNGPELSLKWISRI